MTLSCDTRLLRCFVDTVGVVFRFEVRNSVDANSLQSALRRGVARDILLGVRCHISLAQSESTFFMLLAPLIWVPIFSHVPKANLLFPGQGATEKKGLPTLQRPWGK